MSRLIRSPRDAELVARDYLRRLGFHDVEVTTAGPDGGIDVAGSHVVAQVKAEMVPTGPAIIQQTFGIATALGRRATVFSLHGYTAKALTFADTSGVSLFRFDLQSEVIPVNAAAEALSRHATEIWRVAARAEGTTHGPAYGLVPPAGRAQETQPRAGDLYGRLRWHDEVFTAPGHAVSLALAGDTLFVHAGTPPAAFDGKPLAAHSELLRASFPSFSGFQTMDHGGQGIWTFDLETGDSRGLVSINAPIRSGGESMTAAGTKAWCRTNDTTDESEILRVDTAPLNVDQWQIPLASTGDMVEAEGILLVGGTLGARDEVWALEEVTGEEEMPSYTVVVAVDGSSGDIVWRHVRECSSALERVRVRAASDFAVLTVPTDDGGDLVALDRWTGEHRWSSHIAGWPARHCLGDDLVVVVSQSGSGRPTLEAFDRTGARAWSRSLDPYREWLSFVATPVVNRTAVLSCHGTSRAERRGSGIVLATHLFSGRPIWERELPYPLDCSPVILGDQVVCGASSECTLYSLNAESGDSAWDLALHPILSERTGVHQFEDRLLGRSAGYSLDDTLLSCGEVLVATTREGVIFAIE